jgi:transcription elongation factor Elf1
MRTKQIALPKFDSDGYVHLRKGSEKDFRNKIPSRWMIERIKYSKSTRLYAFFTCPYCGGVNQAYVASGGYTGEEEQDGVFSCIYCKPCGRNLTIQLNNFANEWTKMVKSRKIV